LNILKKDYGNGYAWSQSYLTISTGDSVKWSWKPPAGITGVTYQVVQVRDAVSYAPIGFSSKYLNHCYKNKLNF